VNLFHDGSIKSNYLVAPGACTTRVGALIPRIVVDEDTRVTVQIGRADTRLAGLRLMARYCDLLGSPAVQGRKRGSGSTCAIRGGSDGKNDKRLESKHCPGDARRRGLVIAVGDARRREACNYCWRPVRLFLQFIYAKLLARY
jgi:hypothetical protein